MDIIISKLLSESDVSFFLSREYNTSNKCKHNAGSLLSTINSFSFVCIFWPIVECLCLPCHLFPGVFCLVTTSAHTWLPLKHTTQHTTTTTYNTQHHNYHTQHTTPQLPHTTQHHTIHTTQLNTQEITKHNTINTTNHHT